MVVGGNAVARRVVELLAREPDTAVVLTTSGGESVLDAFEVIGVQGFDLGLLAEMRRLAKDIRSRFGRLDVLVNCAAKMDGHALLETSEDECATPLCCCNWISGSALAA